MYDPPQPARISPAISSEKNSVRPAPAPSALRAAPAGSRTHRLQDFASVANEPIQRMILSMGDLESAAEIAKAQGKDLTDEDTKDARIISDSVERRRKITGEQTVRFAPSTFKSADHPKLSKIGLTEELRIIAHGALDERSGRVAQFGSASAADLVEILGELQLPKDYSGVIFLGGCHTATGDNHGYLGEFYARLTKSGYEKAKVRGTMGPASTTAHGTELVDVSGHVLNQHDVLRAQLASQLSSARAFASLTGVLNSNRPATAGPGAAPARDILAGYLEGGGPTVGAVEGVAAEGQAEALQGVNAIAAAARNLPTESHLSEGAVGATITLPDDAASSAPATAAAASPAGAAMASAATAATVPVVGVPAAVAASAAAAAGAAESPSPPAATNAAAPTTAPTAAPAPVPDAS
jgi:hypothetical protein